MGGAPREAGRRTARSHVGARRRRPRVRRFERRASPRRSDFPGSTTCLDGRGASHRCRTRSEEIAAELGDIIAPEFAAFAMIDGKSSALSGAADYNQTSASSTGGCSRSAFSAHVGRKRSTSHGRWPDDGARAPHRASDRAVDRLVEAAKPWGLKSGSFRGCREQRQLARTLVRAETKLTRLSHLRPCAVRPAAPAGTAAMHKGNRCNGCGTT